MLLSLSIRDFVIVDHLELEFNAGFTALTGETGAGKSLLLDALGFVLGSRAEAICIRDGTERADVAAEFLTSDAVRQWLIDHDMDPTGEPGQNTVLVRRTLDRSGRGRSFIQGVQSPLAQLRDLGDLLLDIHGQHEHQSLMRPSAQGRLLDQHAGLSDLVSQVGALHRQWREAEQAVVDATQAQEAMAAQHQHWSSLLNDLDALNPQPGEWDQLGQEHQRLSNATALIDGTRLLLEALEDQDGAILDQIARLQSRLGTLCHLDPRLDSLAGTLDAGRIQLDDGARQLRRYLADLDTDDGRLADLDTRLSGWHGTARRWRLHPEDLPALHQETRQKLSELDRASDLPALQKTAHERQHQYLSLAASLSRARQAAAHTMATRVTEAMQSLAMAGGRLDIHLEPTAPGVYGLERVEFLVAAHAGGLARPLAKVASGGELSRIGLSIAVVAAAGNPVSTLLFDEVDAGVGGQVATTVGRLLRDLGHTRQVFCVTHLAQVAAHAQHHLQIRKKNSTNGAPVSSAETLTAADRILEIARMLGGSDHTPVALEHARQLLTAANGPPLL
jgi:DNA repair protein RecN (Recombination protein N)